MILRRSRPALLATLLAFLAVLGMSALSGWHSATFHDDDVAHAVSIEHVHTDDGQDDGDSPVHVAAHNVAQAIATPVSEMPSVPVGAVSAAWRIAATTAGAGFDPPSLLRPPRS